MTWLISDANIIIDMDVGGVLDRMFMLPERFAVPNVLYAEELEEHHAHLPALGLVTLDVKPEYVNEAYRLGAIYKQPSHNDLLALSLSKQENCPLLTGDAKLREAAVLEKVDVRGTLWIMGMLFEQKIITYQEAKLAYDKMRKEYRRLPWDEVGSQLRKMKNKK